MRHAEQMGNLSVSLRAIIAVASFFVYAVAAIIVIGQAHSIWAEEHDWAMPAAISNVVYGLPFGSIDSNVFAKFQQGVTPESLNKAVEETGQGDVPRGTLLNEDESLGMGQTLFMATAMRLFGVHLSSISYLFILSIGVTTLAFVLRYQDEPVLLFVPLVFLSLNWVMLSPLYQTSVGVLQAPLGGNRQFGILGILPALHIFFELAYARDHAPARRDWALLGVQAIIMAAGILTRSANAYMLAPSICVGAFRVWRGSRLEGHRILFKSGIVITLGAIFASALIASAPYYWRSGRVLGVLWHRAFVGFAVHPEWPFGNLREVYNCPNIPEGLSRTSSDRNGHCIWWSYPPNQAHPELASGEEYGSEYEAVLRRAFFYVIVSYPRQALELFFYYKPMRFLTVMKDALDFQLSKAPLIIFSLAVLQSAFFVWFVIISAARTPFSPKVVFGTLAVFFLFALTPHLVAAPAFVRSVDLILYLYAAIALAPATVIQALVRMASAAALRKPLIERRAIDLGSLR
jgi:hypothetical protein